MKHDKYSHDDDVVSEGLDDSVVAEESARDTIKKLREKLKEAQRQGKEYLDGWQKERAQFVNWRKQDEKDKQEFAKMANEKLSRELIPVLESFDMAMGNKEAWEKVDKNWRTGVEFIYGQLTKVLENHGVSEMNPVGEKFDHALHEAAGHESVTDEEQDQMVLKVIQKGYALNGKVLKAPKVIIGEYRK